MQLWLLERALLSVRWWRVGSGSRQLALAAGGRSPRSQNSHDYERSYLRRETFFSTPIHLHPIQRPESRTYPRASATISASAWGPENAPAPTLQITNKPTSSGYPKQTAFDRCRASSTLGYKSEASYKTLFFRAIYQQQGNIEQSLPVEQIVHFIDSVDETRRTPSIHSVALGDVNTCRILLQLGCGINKRDETKWMALHHTSKDDYEDIFKLLPDTKQKYTLPHIAIYNKRIGIVSILQLMSIRIKSKDNKGRTPLNLAIDEKNNRKTVSILLHIGANHNMHNKKGENPVLLTANLGRFKIASWIIKHAKVPFSSYNCKVLKGGTILHTAVEKNVNLDIFQTFSREDFDLNIINPQRKSPLLVPAELGYVNIAQEPIIAGICIAAQ